MAEIFAFPKRGKLADDTASVLRTLADKVEAGEVTGLAMAGAVNGEYAIYKFSSLTDSIVLANLLLDSCMREMRA